MHGRNRNSDFSLNISSIDNRLIPELLGKFIYNINSTSE